MQQSQPSRITPDDLETGQTVAFRVHGVSFLIYGRIVANMDEVAEVKTFGDMETLIIPHIDMARKVLSRNELRAMITQYSPARWG